MQYAARARTILKIPGIIPWVVQILRLNLSVGLSKDEKTLFKFLLDRLYHSTSYKAEAKHPNVSWIGCLGCGEIQIVYEKPAYYRVVGCCSVCLPIHGYNHFNTGTIYAGVFNTFGGYLEH